MDEVNRKIEEAYDLYADAIFRYIYVRLKDRERSIELTQDVFMSAHEYLAKGNSIEYLRAFLYRSAHNRFINEIRTDRKMSSLEYLKEGGFDPAGKEDQEIQDRAEQKLLFSKLENLYDSYKEVLLLRYVDGLGVKEIAEILEEDENTISVRIHRGIKKLKEIYNT